MSIHAENKHFCTDPKLHILLSIFTLAISNFLSASNSFFHKSILNLSILLGARVRFLAKKTRMDRRKPGSLEKQPLQVKGDNAHYSVLLWALETMLLCREKKHALLRRLFSRVLALSDDDTSWGAVQDTSAPVSCFAARQSDLKPPCVTRYISAWLVCSRAGAFSETAKCTPAACLCLRGLYKFDACALDLFEI